MVFADQGPPLYPNGLGANRIRPCALRDRSKMRRVAAVQALQKKGIEALFPIQKSVFDPAMAGSDLVGRARTGSGKTLAFSIPIIESILKENAEKNIGRGRRNPRALIMAPTRELVKQVAGELESATVKGSGIEVATVYGGTAINPQMRQIERGIDVLVGTPGRLIDLLQNRRCVVAPPPSSVCCVWEPPDRFSATQCLGHYCRFRKGPLGGGGRAPSRRRPCPPSERHRAPTADLFARCPVNAHARALYPRPPHCARRAGL